jgi:hypothetical protein
MIDIYIFNGYILFQLHRAEHPDVEELKRPKKYSKVEFREELVRQLSGFDEYGNPPVFNPSAKKPGSYETAHIPKFTEAKRNCKVRYETNKQILKVVSFCSAPSVVYTCTVHKTKIVFKYGIARIRCTTNDCIII